MIWLKGATAYEIQIRHFGMRIVHLPHGGWFKWWAPWRRVSFQWFTKDQL